MDFFRTFSFRNESVRHLTFVLPAILSLFIHVSPLSAAGKILSIQSGRFTPYEESIKGFESTCNAQLERFVISEMKDKDLIKEIRKNNPSVILSIGIDALEAVKLIDDIPVVYLMVPNPQSVSGTGSNLTGVRMSVSQEDQLLTFLKAVPGIKNIGLIYNQEKSGYAAQKAMDACKAAGVNLIARKITDAREAPSVILEMKGRIDGLWMLPDTTVLTPATLECLFLFSIENRVPILSFADIHLDSGALISVSVSPFDMGAQAGQIAAELLSGKSVSAIQPVDAREKVISINLKTAGKLGITIDEDAFSGAKFLR